MNKVQAGHLYFGVMELAEGYRAGYFLDGAGKDDGDRNMLIRAFLLRQRYCKKYSEKLFQQGNKESAKFYLRKSKQLRQQID